MRDGFIIDYETVAARLAHEDSKIQARFISVFLKELRYAASTNYNVEMQLCYMNAELSATDRETLKMLSFTENEHGSTQ
ncbi:MAG: hypothetical protein M0R06_20265 [Sphaerochaeta sp.]|jgi:hypothetical protein|nr:hypothetical protein [Sphaerochaeta sp.]